MVRYVNPPSGISCSENSRFKSRICQPKDNIGIACVVSEENVTAKDKPSTGLRRRYAIPKDNLGIACLPTVESVALRDIPEISEYDSAEEAFSKTIADTSVLEKRKNRSTFVKITSKAKRTVAPKNNPSTSRRRVNASEQVRLRAGEDGDQIQYRSTECNGGSKNDRVVRFGIKKNVDFFDDSERLVLPSKMVQFKPTSLDIGISNIRRPKHDPVHPRKPIVPKDNIGFSGRHLQKSLVRTSGGKTSGIHDLKVPHQLERKSTPSSKSLSNTSEQRIPMRNKSLKANCDKQKSDEENHSDT